MLEPAVSKGLDEVILKSLDKEATCRYQTATDMARDLKHAIRVPRGGFVDKQPGSGKRITEKIKGVLTHDDFWKRARLWAVVLVSAVVMTLGVYYGSSLY
ncbi:MAG: hypothetical protein RR739_07300, partial [Clostridia bacterium]